MAKRLFRHLTITAILSFFAASSWAQLVANAGADKSICPGAVTTIGGIPLAASGGQAPYTYIWLPADGLSNPNVPNPVASPTVTTDYLLQVIDDTGAISYDIVRVTASVLNQISAGNDTSICEKSYALLGGPGNLTGIGATYSWLPTVTLDDASAPRPVSNTGSTMTFTLTATAAGCPPKTDAITVTVIPTPQIDAGTDTTIQEGEIATLHATGAFFYAWGPIDNLKYYYTANPDAEPTVTTTYQLYGEDESGKCPAYDSVTVFVEPSDAVIIYNTFTPNADGNNDTWYIGNIQKYPENRLEIYNRNGRLVYKTTNYQSTWDGRAFGQDLPAATYFYVLDLGKGNDVMHGTVTIVK